MPQKEAYYYLLLAEEAQEKEKNLEATVFQQQLQDYLDDIEHSLLQQICQNTWLQLKPSAYAALASDALQWQLLQHDQYFLETLLGPLPYSEEDLDARFAVLAERHPKWVEQLVAQLEHSCSCHHHHDIETSCVCTKEGKAQVCSCHQH